MASNKHPENYGGPYKTAPPPRLDLEHTTHPFANSNAKLEIIPSSDRKVIDDEHTPASEVASLSSYPVSLDGIGEWDSSGRSASGIDIEEEASLMITQSPLPRFPSPPPSVFSSDIYIGDNTNQPTLAFARDVRISGWSNVGDVNTAKSPTLMQGMGISSSGGAYVVYDCVITTKEGAKIHTLKRYSDFEHLDSTLRRTLPRSLVPSLPTLPPKAPLARFRPAFLDRRRRLLQFWLASVLLHPEIGASDAARAWVTA
ncbi:Phox homologous domain-containing protein [Crucibulum laeve]|uniref:Endosomal/vacuolar adapter protein YPT35 n=1 Tax=Crucibulum laeve TaxID=68775 RepID=A0A5C3LLN2_9AGAR|nr:Phox homologous domain-containing protein [Crucibulum laeve]